MSTLPVTLDRADRRPLGVQLSERVRTLVLRGTLRRGDRLPSSRSLARDLGVSRSVTEQAYEQLLAEGWVETRHGSGTFVASHGLAPPLEVPRPRQRRQADLVHLDPGVPWIDPRHTAAWRRAWREVSASRAPHGYDDPRGLPELRELLADRLSRTRGLSVPPEKVLVTGGTVDGLIHVLHALRPGPVGIEDPGYRAAVAATRALGRGVHDLPAAEPVTDLSGVAAAYVTPAHQHPLGPVMAASDRLALLEAARRSGAVVVEDDYDSEFRYDVAPVPALASLDPDVVAYLGTTAKTVMPSLRLGWLVAPDQVHDEVARRRELTHDAAPWPTQRALVALLRDGYLDRVVRSARRVYADRAQRVADAVAPHATSAGRIAGMYTTWLMPQPVALHVRAEAEKSGFGINLLSDYCRSSELHGLVIGFGGVDDESLDRALAVVRAALERTST